MFVIPEYLAAVSGTRTFAATNALWPTDNVVRSNITAQTRFVYGMARSAYRILTCGDWSRRMPKRFITRIELTVPTRTKLTDVSHSNGMTQVAVLSRIVQWFAAQPETIQAAILGRYPVEIEPDVAKLLLERMANGQKK